RFCHFITTGSPQNCRFMVYVCRHPASHSYLHFLRSRVEVLNTMRSFPGFNIALSVLYFCFVVFSLSAKADELDIQIEIPAIDASPYHRPYVAIWLETTEREGVETIAVWHEQEEWLRDMRQWWRKLG